PACRLYASLGLGEGAGRETRSGWCASASTPRLRFRSFRIRWLGKPPISLLPKMIMRSGRKSSDLGSRRKGDSQRAEQEAEHQNGQTKADCAIRQEFHRPLAVQRCWRKRVRDHEKQPHEEG